MKTNKTAYNYISDYLIEVRSKGRFAITLEELRSKFDVSEKALLQNIYRLKTKNQIAQIRKEFYVIIPPQYSNRGMLPPSLFIDDMMKFLGRNYYVGLYSAAALHGAGHQQPMEFHVIIKKPALRNIKNQKLTLSFFTKGEGDILKAKGRVVKPGKRVNFCEAEVYAVNGNAETLKRKSGSSNQNR